MRLKTSACLLALATLLTGSVASADYMITDLATSQSPLSSDGGGTLTHLPGSAEVQADELAGFQNAFNFFVPRGFAGSLAEQLVTHDTIEFDRRNIPDPNNASGFINTFFVLNSDAGPVTGYTVIGDPQYLDPNNAVTDDFVFNYGAHSNAVQTLQNYNAGLGTFLVVHIVQQSGGPSSVAYGDLSLTGAIPEPSTLALFVPALIGVMARRRRV